jgi:hypothetical protein
VKRWRQTLLTGRLQPIKPMMARMFRLAALAASSVLIGSATASAQSEEALKSFFEGHRVTVRIDMPGTQEGVDVHADARRPLDMDDYRSNLRKYGVALRAGESSTVTLVKVKKDLIEFQLAGGGYGAFGDDTSTTVYMPLLEKSERERELERRIKDEDDRERRHRMERELDDLREQRERENRRIESEKERAEARKAELVAERRLTGGSRFNIRYDDRVPPGMRPQDVMAALADYVDFDNVPTMTPPMPPPTGDVSLLRKGMSRADAERVFGPPAQASQKTTGDFTVVTLVFETPAQRVSADFVEDLLVRYAVSSK